MTKKVTFNGQEHPVKYNINAIIEFEELTGYDLSTGILVKELAKTKNMRDFIYVGLKNGADVEGQEFKFDLHHVGKFVKMTDLTKYIDVLKSDIDLGGGEEGEQTEEKK